MCGSIRYEVHGSPRNAIACHCEQCRKSSGHFLAATAVAPEDLVLLSQDSLKWYRTSDSARRAFCECCGSTLFWEPASADRISIFLGTIDGPTGLPLTAHIFTAEKGDYYTIEDSAEQYQGHGASLSVD
jgi:hypothetical protein